MRSRIPMTEKKNKKTRMRYTSRLGSPPFSIPRENKVIVLRGAKALYVRSRTLVFLFFSWYST